MNALLAFLRFVQPVWNFLLTITVEVLWKKWRAYQDRKNKKKEQAAAIDKNSEELRRKLEEAADDIKKQEDAIDDFFNGSR